MSFWLGIALLACLHTLPETAGGSQEGLALLLKPANPFIFLEGFYNLNWHALEPGSPSRYIQVKGRASTSQGRVVTAATKGGEFLVTYFMGPSPAVIRINMDSQAAELRGYWYDLTNGRKRDVPILSPETAAGWREIDGPGLNASGDTDWTLVLASEEYDRLGNASP